jgi:hypothetical protein
VRPMPRHLVPCSCRLLTAGAVCFKCILMLSLIAHAVPAALLPAACAAS